MKKTYSTEFYEYINSGSLASAKIIVPQIIELFNPSSVLDIGCGAGAWCSVWIKHDTPEVLGIDGDYIKEENLLINKKYFEAADLGAPVDLKRKFDLAISLEVAEHIPEEKSNIFVENLTRHADVIIFSAAVPGQGGEFHVNEQPLEYWREKFARLDYWCFDPLRGVIKNIDNIEPWYRYNILVYVSKKRMQELPERIKTSRIEPGIPIPDVSSISWKIRNRIIQTLPNSLIKFLVKIKHTWMRKRYATH